MHHLDLIDVHARMNYVLSYEAPRLNGLNHHTDLCCQIYSLTLSKYCGRKAIYPFHEAIDDDPEIDSEQYHRYRPHCEYLRSSWGVRAR
mmetsp:Transcript_33652/g.83911  ORF Transcript_33652/g.83911 Transcript_33652/m.83911 type:complete len:89 (+) Transcript_33652:215-481(+)